MNMKRPRLDDTLSFVLVVTFVLLAVGLQVSVQAGYVLDRGSVQAHADQREKAIRLAEAASAAAQPNGVRVAMRHP
jgi:hypothetical protein